MHIEDQQILDACQAEYKAHEGVICDAKKLWDSGDYYLWHCRIKKDGNEELWKKHNIENHNCSYPDCPFNKGVGMPSAVEVKNAQKVLAMIEQIDDITYNQIREDVIEVTETVSGNNFSVLVDAEEKVISLLMEVGNVPANGSAQPLMEKLLAANGKAVHGFFCTVGDKVVLKDNLEVDNLDQNELEAGLLHMFMSAQNTLPEIAEHIS